MGVCGWRRVSLWGVVLSCVLSLSGCGEDDHDHEHSEEGALSELCEHMKTGPAVEVLAAAQGGVAPSISEPHTRYDLTWVAGESGAVRFDAGEAGSFIVLSSAESPLTAQDLSGTVVAPLETHRGADVSCAEDAAVYHVFSFAVGSHVLTFGPEAGLGSLSVVIERAAEEGP